MKFVKYSSIENSYRKKYIDQIIEQGHFHEEYVVQEKIHGANFSFWIDENSVKCAKRTAFIGESENFYSYEFVVDKYEEKMLKLYSVLKQHFEQEDVTEVAVFGELYGGLYPHQDVKDTDHSAVQKHVYYRPDEDFIAFDIRIDDRFLTVNEVNMFCEEVGIPYVETLFSGNLEECLKYTNEFQTTIPAKLGLPEIEGNICEGVVIRPKQPIFMWNGSRLLIKNKNDKFKEKHGDKKTGNRQPREIKPLEPHVQKAVDNARMYVNENRLRNVLSKVGEVGSKDFGKLMGLFTQDILEDYLKEQEDGFQDFAKSERKTVTKMVGQNAAELLRKNFVNILDGEF